MRVRSFRSIALGVVCCLLFEQFRVWLITYPFLHAETFLVPLAMYCLLIVALLQRHDHSWARLALYVISALTVLYQVFLAVPSIVSPFIVVLGDMHEADGRVIGESLLDEVRQLFVVAVVLMSALEARSLGKRPAA